MIFWLMLALDFLTKGRETSTPAASPLASALVPGTRGTAEGAHVAIPIVIVTTGPRSIAWVPQRVNDEALSKLVIGEVVDVTLDTGAPAGTARWTGRVFSVRGAA